MRVCHLARLAVLVFLAGPALNLECLLSCTPSDVAAASDDCHRPSTGTPTMSSGGGCGEGLEGPAPYLRSGAATSVLFIAPESLFSIVARTLRVTTTAVLVSEPGPPDRFAAIPLRI